MPAALPTAHMAERAHQVPIRDIQPSVSERSAPWGREGERICDVSNEGRRDRAAPRRKSAIVVSILVTIGESVGFD